MDKDYKPLENFLPKQCETSPSKSGYDQCNIAQRERTAKEVCQSKAKEYYNLAQKFDALAASLPDKMEHDANSILCSLVLNIK